MQMPYFAYSLGGNVINIVPLFERNLILTRKINMEEGEEIQKLIFSYNKNLYVITRKLNEEKNNYTRFYAYLIKVQEEIGNKVDKAAELGES